jgi:ribosomal protein L18E
MNKHWASLVEFYSANAKKIQKQSQKSVKNILKKISLNQAEVTVFVIFYLLKCGRMF